MVRIGVFFDGTGNNMWNDLANGSTIYYFAYSGYLLDGDR